MSAHLVETTEEDSYIALIQYVGDLINQGKDRTALAETPGSRFAEEGEGLYTNSNFGDLLLVLIKHFDLLFQTGNPSDLETSLGLLCHLAGRIDSDDPKLKSCIDAFTSALTKGIQVEGKDEHAEQKLQTLVELYNVLTDLPLKASVLLQAVDFALKASLATRLAPTIKGHVDTYVEDLKLDRAAQRQLYLNTSKLVLAGRKKPSAKLVQESWALTLKFLGTFDEASTATELSGAKQSVADALVEFIKNPDLFQFDMLDSPAVQQLKGDAKFGGIYELTSLLLTGDMKGYEHFVQSNKGAVVVQEEDLRTKMRISALIALASQRLEIPLSAIQEKLGVDEGKVEAWVVKAISKKLIEGRMDQMTRALTITKRTQRSFAMEQWGQLEKQLVEWKRSVKELTSLLGAKAVPGGYDGITA